MNRPFTFLLFPFYLFLVLHAIRYTQYDIRIHYQAQLIEKCTHYGAGGHLEFTLLK